MLESILHDLRYAARSLIRQPGVTALMVGILALGLGLNAAVLAVAYGVLWRPLPYPAADRLVTVAQVNLENGSEAGVAFDRIDEWNRRLRTVRVAGYHTRERVVRGAGPTGVREVATVSRGFFEVIGVPSSQGAVPRLAGGDGRAVISAALARAVEDETGRSAVGRAVTIGGGRYDVAAVVPAAFAFPSAGVEAWVADQPDFGGERGTVGRMRDGVSLAQVRDDAARVVREVGDALGAGGDRWGAAVTPVEETLFGEVRPVLRVSVAAALLVLVVACANAATLLVGRSAARRREFAVRIALGSGLARLVRAALVEGLAMAVGGLVLGLAAAWAGLRLFAAAAIGAMPRVGAVALDPPVVLAGLVLTLLVGVACGGASVAGAVRGDGAALRGGAAAAGSRAAGRLRAGLVAGQIALSIVLLSGAGLLVRTVERLLDEEGGFEPRQALTARLMLADTSFLEGDAQAQTAFVDSLLERVRGLPGVQAAGVGSVLPPDDDRVSVQLVYEDDRGEASRREIVLSFGAVTRGYFAALGTRLREGRRFRRRRQHRGGGSTDTERDRRAFRLPERGSGRPSAAVRRHRCPRHRGRGVAGHRRRRRHEVQGARRPAGRLALCPVAAGADRCVPPRGADHRRSDGAGPRDSRPHPDPGPVSARPRGTDAGRPRRRLDRRAAAARPADGRLRGPRAGRGDGRPLRRPGPGGRRTAAGAGHPRRRRRVAGPARPARPAERGRRHRSGAGGGGCRRRPRPAAASPRCSTASAPTTPPRSRRSPPPSSSPRWAPRRFRRAGPPGSTR